MGIYCITNKQTENQVSEGGFVWTNNKSMTWNTNYNESNLSPLKGNIIKLGSSQMKYGKYASGRRNSKCTSPAIENLE